MLKKMLCVGLLFVPSLISAGLWDMLLQDNEISARVALLTDSEKESLKSWCEDRDVWQREATENLISKAQSNQEGVALFQQVVDAAEVHVVCDLNWVKNKSYSEESPEIHAEHHEAEKVAA